MKTKSFAARIKSVGTTDDEDSGEFEALVSVFGNVDHYGEVVMPGAFKASLAQWKDRGDPIPVIWSHQWADPFSHLGIVKSAEETEKGLLIKGFISPEERAEKSNRSPGLQAPQIPTRHAVQLRVRRRRGR